MKLGGSIGRRRPARKRARRRRARRRVGGSSGGFRMAGIPRLAFRGALLLAAMVATGYGVATRVVFPVPAPPPDLLEVPDLGRLDMAGAQGRVEAAGLVLGAIDSVYHPSAPSGSIFGQSPLPGQLAVPGADVELTVSLGAEQRVVPDMIGLPGERAHILLGANGFAVAVDSVEGEAPAGEVVGMEPLAGTDVNLPAEVRLAISLGPPMVEMPLLLGQSEEDAVALLDSLGLFVTEIEHDSLPVVDPEVVIEQEPPAGTLVEVGSDVTLVLGEGTPPPVDSLPPGTPARQELLPEARP